MSDLHAGLRPVTGSPADVETAVRRWWDDDGAGPLTLRTSGSTGQAKDVLLSKAALRASATATHDRLGGPGQWVLALPAHYVAGLQVIIRSLLAGCSPVVLADHNNLSDATDAVTARRTYLAIVPTQLHRFLSDKADTAALTRYDAVLLGGSAAPSGLLEQARRRGVKVVTTYGMSETCGGCVYDGVALDGVAVALDDDGRIRLGGPVLFEGYAGQPRQTAEVLRDGWFRTEDLGRFDTDGRLDVLGRVDDVAISGGVNVPLPAVQRRIEAMPGVDACAVVSVPDPEWGERVGAVLGVSDPDLVPTTSAVRDFVSRSHPREWAPTMVAVVDRLPMLETGKPDRAALRSLLREASGRGTSQRPSLRKANR